MMKRKMNRSKILVYGFIGVVLLAIITAAVIYLPTIMQSMHGAG